MFLGFICGRLLAFSFEGLMFEGVLEGFFVLD